MERGHWGGMPRWSAWRRPVTHLAIVVLFVLVVLGNAPSPKSAADAADASHPSQAGAALNTYSTVAHGDTREEKRHVDAIAHDLARSERVPDVARPIDHEAARAVVQPLPGVRSAMWLDAAHFVVMVDDPRRRSMDMIDRVCLALEPLGDTLGVVVNLQNVGAKNADAAMTLSRNCQLPIGERAFVQGKRQVDAIEPELRRTLKAQQKKSL